VGPATEQREGIFFWHAQHLTEIIFSLPPAFGKRARPATGLEEYLELASTAQANQSAVCGKLCENRRDLQQGEHDMLPGSEPSMPLPRLATSFLNAEFTREKWG